MTDAQIFIDRMLGTENLTDYLEDDDADYLINWGVAQLKELVGGIEDDSSAGECTNNLMGFMRTLNQIAGNLEAVDPDDLANLMDRFQKVFGPGRDLAQVDYLGLASDLVAMTPRQAIDYLLLWPKGVANSPSEENLPSGENQPPEEDSSQD